MDVKKELLKKLMEKKEKVNPERELKLRALDSLDEFMGNLDLEDLLSNAKASVTVAADDPKKLPEALDKAKELVEKAPVLEKEKPMSDLFAEKKEEKEESGLEDLDDLSVEDLKKLLKELL